MAEVQDRRAEQEDAEQEDEGGGTAWLAFVFTGFLIGFIGVFTFNERDGGSVASPVQTAAFEPAIVVAAQPAGLR